MYSIFFDFWFWPTFYFYFYFYFQLSLSTFDSQLHVLLLLLATTTTVSRPCRICTTPEGNTHIHTCKRTPPRFSKQPLGPPNPIRCQKRTTKFRLWCGGRKTSRTTFQFGRCNLPNKFVWWSISDQHCVRTAPTTFAALHIGAVQRVAALIHVRFRCRWVWKIPQQRFRQCVVHVCCVVGRGDPIPIQRGLQMWSVLHQQFRKSRFDVRQMLTGYHCFHA